MKDLYTRNRHFAFDRFAGNISVRIDDHGHPLQLSIVMYGDGLHFAPFTHALSQMITYAFTHHDPIQEIRQMYNYFKPLRSLKGMADLPPADSTQDAIFNCVMTWLFEEFILDPAKAEEESKQMIFRV